MLLMVQFVRSHSRGCAPISANVLDWVIKIMVDMLPCAHILVLFLDPCALGISLVLLNEFFDLSFRKGVELLDPQDRDIGTILFLSFGGKLIVDFA